jgi:hypothetical protein
MKKLHTGVFALSLLVSAFAFGADSISVNKRYSRGDDDLAYTYRTAFLNTSLKLQKAEGGYLASVTFLATISTPEAQGFTEAVRFGMRESARSFGLDSRSLRSVTIESQPVIFKFVQGSTNGFQVDQSTQQAAESLSNAAFQSREGVPGNRPEADGKTLGGTLNLGMLDEGFHSGTIFVQQMVGQTPSTTDTDISVRHLIRWSANVVNGDIRVDVQNGNYLTSDATVQIAAPSWDGTIRPHRVELLRDEVVVDGQTFASATAQYGQAHLDKATVLRTMDEEEFEREYNRKERSQIAKEAKKKEREDKKAARQGIAQTGNGQPVAENPTSGDRNKKPKKSR